MILLLYVVAKYAVYAVCCYLLLRVVGLRVKDPISFAASWGGVRLLLGLTVGIPMFYVYTLWLSAGTSESVSYVLSFVLLRYIEWLLLFLLIARKHHLRLSARAQAWIVSGVLVSCAADWLAVQTKLTETKLFC